MFGRQRKSECHRIREMFSPYLDDCVTSVDRDAVKYHIEICKDCEWELRSMGITVQLLSRMPVAPAPRSFTLAEAPRRYGIPFAIPSMNRLRLATAMAVVLLAILLAGDFGEFFYRDVVAEQEEVAEDRVPIDVAEPEIAPERLAEYPAQHIVGIPPEAVEPVPCPYRLEGRYITQPIELGVERYLPFEVLAPPYVAIPEAPKPLREPHPWLWPLQIASAALVLALGGANLLVWKRKRAYTC